MIDPEDLPPVAISKMDPAYVARLRDVAFNHLDRGRAMAALDIIGAAGRLQTTLDGMPQVEALMSAGWLFECVHENSEPWQWAWRRPKRRANSKGMRFASTNQAYQALRKENPELPELYH
jgi:hypothetical protein